MANPYKVKFYSDKCDDYTIYYRVKNEMNEPDVNLNIDIAALCQSKDNISMFRESLSTQEYIEAVRLGMQLASLGYDGIEVEVDGNKIEV